MSEAKNHKQVMEGLQRIYQRIAGFHAQRAFFEGRPLVWQANEPVGLDLMSQAYRDRIFMGGFGCGKSYILDFTLLALLAQQPDNMAVILRKRFEQLRNTTLATFWGIVEEATDGEKERLIADVDEKDGAIQVLIRTSGKPSRAIFRVEPDGTDEAVRDSLKGYELGCFGLDEATQLKKVSYDTLKTRLRRPGFVLAGLVASNPAGTAHWLTRVVQNAERDYEQGTRPNELVIRARSFDNPYLRSDYIDQLKLQYKDDPAGYDMYVLGKDGLEVQGKPVFRKDFNDKVHVDSNIRFNPYLPLYIGLDFGFHHPAAIWFQRDDRDRFNVIAEKVGEDIGIDAWGDLILDFNKTHFKTARDIVYFGDPAGAQLSDKGDPTIHQLARKGIHVHYRPHEDVNVGVELIRRLMTTMVDGRPRLVFHPRCKVLMEAFRGGYYYKQHSDGSYGAKPHKDGFYDHPVDAFRYGVENVTLAGSDMRKLPAVAEGMTRIRM